MSLFLHEAQITGYADDRTPFVVIDNMPDMISALEEIGEKLLSPATFCHLPSNAQDQNFPKVGKFNVKNSFSEKLLGTTFDAKLKFNNHIEDICTKATKSLMSGLA